MNKKYKYYYIYLITNKITGKKYVGQHRSNILENNYYGSSKSLKDDIKLLGKHCFEKKIIEVFSYDSFLDRLEAYYIGKYNTYEDGYNKTRTGSIDRNLIIFKNNNRTYKYICPNCNKKSNSKLFTQLHFEHCDSLKPKYDRSSHWKMFDKN